MISIKDLKNISKSDIAIAGGKGASLGEMVEIGISIPSGFVVLADAFEKFLEESDLDIEIESILKKINYKDINSVDKASNQIRDLILDAEFPNSLVKEVNKEFSKLKVKYVAVRSSATAEDSLVASWAGELESYLNTTKTNLIKNIKKCWASLFSPRAIFYRFEKKLHASKISVAVIVQSMIQSEVSGICFTVHPITKDYNQLIIEAGYGLGEAIVGGKITPDSYVVDKKSRKIINKNINNQKLMIVKSVDGVKEKKIVLNKQNKQKLSDDEIKKLSALCIKIEKHYGCPQDIEWAIWHKKIYIVQSRPITTL